MSIPFVVDSDTSRMAAESVVSLVRGHEKTVLELLRRCQMTDDALEEATGLPHQTVSARRNGLVAKGLVEDSGQTAPTRSGRQAVVWRVTPAPRPITATARNGKMRRPDPDVLRAAAAMLTASGNDGVALVAEWLLATASKKGR